MARYVLVEFEDNAKAKAFVEKVNGENAAIDMPARGFRVRAVWPKPTKFCECTKADRSQSSYRRGEKTGWWIHAVCGRPSKQWGEKHTHWFSAIGKNLLPGNKDFDPTDPKQSSQWGYL